MWLKLVTSRDDEKTCRRTLDHVGRKLQDVFGACFWLLLQWFYDFLVWKTYFWWFKRDTQWSATQRAMETFGLLLILDFLGWPRGLGLARICRSWKAAVLSRIRSLARHVPLEAAEVLAPGGLPGCHPAPDGMDTDRGRAGSAGGSGARLWPVEI